MVEKLFGTDGVRGLANAHPMTPEIAFRIGAAVTHQAKRSLDRAPRIVIGKDTRLSGYMLETALASGVCALGGRVMIAGVLPTPGIAHIATSMRADAGIVVSASHNSYEDNGIKVFGRDGFKLPDAVEAELEALLRGKALDEDRPHGTHVGKAERLEDARGRYVAFAKATFPNDLTLEGLRIVVDAANGAAYRVAPSVFQELGATVFPIAIKPNGKNINADCGALHPEHCASEVLRHRAHLGIALDGDADRVIVIDEKGKEVDGDVVMALCASRMLREGTLKKRTLVATVMSNLGLERAIEKQKGKMVRASVGDRYVVEAMRMGGYNFGGEQSGHLIFLDHCTTGDGLVAALQLLALVIREERPLSELAHDVMERVPQVLLNISLPKRMPLDAMPRAQKAIAQVEKTLKKNGRVLVRWSGTEPKLRIMVEGPDAKKIRLYAESIGEAAKADGGKG